MRRTGYTSKMLVKVLTDVLDGKRCAVAAHTDRYARQLYMEFNRLIQAACAVQSTTDSGRKLTGCMESKGSVRFFGGKSVAISNYLREAKTQLWEDNSLWDANG